MNTNPFDKDKNFPPWIKFEEVMAYTETKITSSLVAYPSSIEQCFELIEFAKNRGVTICPRGSGYSFGDMILNNGHIILKMNHMNRILQWDDSKGQIIVEPGVTLAQIFMKSFLFNWIIPACPGASEVTVGGAISNNVHGKDSWSNGNFGKQVISLRLLTSSQEIISIHHQKDRQLFEAVVSGMGLLGIIVEATLQLKKIPSPFVETKLEPTRNIEDLSEKLEDSKNNYDFSVGWVDSFAKKSNFGRGFLNVGRWIDDKTQFSPEKLSKSLSEPKRIYGILPPKTTWFLLQPFFGRSFIRLSNTAQYYLIRILTTLGSTKTKKKSFTDYNFMLNKLPGYSQLFKHHGFIEIQPMIPLKNGIGAIKDIFKLCHEFNYPPLMVGFKAHRSDNYMFSYSGEGYSFGCDVTLRKCNHQRLRQFAREISQLTLDYGGKVYLAKDELLPRDIFQKMYPRYKEFLTVKSQLDPETLFSSDMYRRLLY